MIRILLVIFFFLWVVPVRAIYDPLSVPNNKYGMHIADFNDIADVAPLVNSTGGDWGYITLVATDNDLDTSRWQKMFDQMRRLHLIPLVRIATHVEKDYWVKPHPNSFDTIVAFFNGLNWPTENRYVILYNEPNHAKEWGGELNPEDYVSTFVELARKFKAASSDFFVLPAGLDASAASDGQSMDATEYLRRMIAARPEFLDLIDGWNSHSYPNPAFSGSPEARGRGTIRSYTWETEYLKSLGLNRHLPIFIAETGWMRGALTSEQIGANMLAAASGAWNDSKIAAITPFIFNYQDVPFDSFSWKRLSRDGGGYYPQYEAYKAITKTKGQPKQRESYELIDQLLPPILVAESTYTLTARVANNGQGILSAKDGYELVFDSGDKSFALIADILPTIEPGEKGDITIHLRAPKEPGVYRISLRLKHFDQTIPLQTQDIQIVPPPSITVEAPLGWRREDEASDVTVLVYDDTKLLHKFTGLTLSHGKVAVEGLTGVIPNYSYRIVILVPYYLPRQAIVPLASTHTTVAMKRLLPLDFNRDGTFTLVDVWALITKPPRDMIKLFISP